jgi:hypothetical protein
MYVKSVTGVVKSNHQLPISDFQKFGVRFAVPDMLSSMDDRRRQPSKRFDSLEQPV